MICPGSVLKSPEGERIIVILSVERTTPQVVRCLHASMSLSVIIDIRLWEIQDDLDRGNLVPADGIILALGLAYFEQQIRNESSSRDRGISDQRS